jgi:hypothetical protein
VSGIGFGTDLEEIADAEFGVAEERTFFGSNQHAGDGEDVVARGLLDGLRQFLGAFFLARV